LAYKDNKQPAEAIKAFRNTVVLVPNLVDAHMQLGILHFNEQQPRRPGSLLRKYPPGARERQRPLAQQYLEFLKKSGK